LVVELTRDLSAARAEAAIYRELLCLTLTLDGETQRENRIVLQRLDRVLTMRRGESLGLDA
jgi:hypothetical protein